MCNILYTIVNVKNLQIKVYRTKDINKVDTALQPEDLCFMFFIYYYFGSRQVYYVQYQYCFKITKHIQFLQCTFNMLQYLNIISLYTSIFYILKIINFKLNYNNLKLRSLFNLLIQLFIVLRVSIVLMYQFNLTRQLLIRVY